MYGTLLARAFFLSERTVVKTGMCVAEQLFALRTKSCILLFLPAIETDHDLYGSLFLSDTRFFICFHLFSFGFGGWLHFGKDNKLIAYSAKNFHWNDCRCWKLCVSLLCPQCKIAALYVVNDRKERLLVYVLENGEVVPKDPAASTDGFDLTEVYCLGCSWHGSPKRLVKR